ncbi:MAG: chromosome condensation regulator RCC1, partial [Gaiellales bacterium]|nr:chromosome condensation regulator RCC1 [Gaiellales bacterium]
MASRHRLLVLAVIVLLLASAAPPQVAADTDVDSGLAALLSSGVAVQAIATGGSHTCALTIAGGAKCWGRNDFGQLGDGSTTNRSEPVDVAGLTSGVAAIAAGGSHTCAVTTGGSLLCWGDNVRGQLGDGTTTDRSEPVYVTNLSSGVAAVTCGYQHTCARTTAGGAKCWGYNSLGQLGNGTTTSRLTPVDVTGLTSGVASLSAGYSHTCAVTTGGAAKCWGGGGHGELGDGTSGLDADKTTPVDVSGLGSGVAAVSAGGYHTCALTTGGGIKCWGLNNYGQLGDWTTTRRVTPVDSQGVESGMAAVTAG